MTNMTDVHRVPLHQLMNGDVPVVCTDDELGKFFCMPLTPARMSSCIGSIWKEQHEGMEELFRWTKPVADASGSHFTHHSRTGFANAQGPHWNGYRRQVSLGWTWRLDKDLSAHPDLAAAQHYRFVGDDPGDGFFVVNGIEDYPGMEPAWPRPIEPTDPLGGFVVHAPQVVRVSFDLATQRISVDPEVLVVTRGGGAPIRFLRGNGANAGRAEWSFAALELAENNPTTPPEGSTYVPVSQFITRHVSSSEFLIVDNYELPAGASVEDFKYRITVRCVEGVFSVDPKVRNGSAAGSGGG